MAEAGFVLIRLDNQDSFVFQFFPKDLDWSQRANWSPQDVTTGTQPLFYANREPRRINVPELYLDSTETGESLTPDLKKLRSLHDESEQEGTPPPLLAAWGDRQERCVLEDLKVTEEFFNESGHPLRVKISLTLLEVQNENSESTSVRLVEDTRPRRVGG